MKLSDLFETKQHTFIFSGFSGMEDSGAADFNVKVTYEVEAGSHSDHPYGEGTAREDHPAQYHIVKLEADEAVQLTDDSGQVCSTYTKGKNLTTMSEWKDSMYSEFEEAARKEQE